MMLCDKVNMSRQNYYKARKLRCRREVDEGLAVELVKSERALQPRIGGRKLHVLLQPKLEEAGVQIGRDRFFEVLGDNGLLLERLPKSARTTYSRHSLPVFTNLVKDMELTAPNQAWASDITYLRIDGGFVYLSLITDMYSRKIVGYHAGNTLETEGCLRALEMAVRGLSKDERPVHHSDRGSQYCSHLYTGRLRDYGLGISMTEENHCYENALAERINGILKQEYWLGGTFRNKDQAVDAVKEAVWLYNTRRPHQSLGYEIPEQIHRKHRKIA